MSELDSKRVFVTGSAAGIGVSSCEMTDDAQIERAVGGAVEILGGLEVVVNNAGIQVASQFASDRATWVTGSNYILDGGLTASLV